MKGAGTDFTAVKEQIKKDREIDMMMGDTPENPHEAKADWLASERAREEQLEKIKELENAP